MNELTFTYVLLLKPLKRAGATQPVDAPVILRRTGTVGRHNRPEAAKNSQSAALCGRTAAECSVVAAPRLVILQTASDRSTT